MLNREQYEKQLERLARQAGFAIKSVERFTDIDLIARINNYLTYFGCLTFNNDEIERILNATK